MSTLLPERASHVFFLRQLADEKVPGTPASCLGDLTTAQVVRDFIRPATAKRKSNYVDCLRQGLLDPRFSPRWCPKGVLQGTPSSPPAFGPTNHFASHSWTYKFGELVGLLEGHYAGLPETKGGRLFVATYYWVDILAVTQHFTGDFKDHPDSDFPGVIKASQSVLFTMHPWRSPVAPTRVWCLFEALTALQCPGVSLDVVLDMGSSRDVSTRSLMTIVSSIDVRASQATVPADRTYLLGCIEAGPGAMAFNAVMRKALMTNLLKAMAAKCMDTGDGRGLAELMKVGACRRPDGVLDVAANLPYANTSDVVSLLDGFTSASCPRGLVLAGYLHCLQDFPEEDPETGAWSVAERYNGSREAWSYMPVSDAVAGAVGRLLQRQPSLVHRGSYEEGGNVLGGLISVAAAAAAAMAAVGHGAGSSSSGGSSSFSDGSTGLKELWLSLREAKHTGKMVPGAGGGMGASASPSRASRAASISSPITSTQSPHGSFRAPVAGRRAGSITGAKMLATANSMASLMGEASGGMSRPSEVDAGVAGREELWYGLSLRSPLQLLCLHRSSLTMRDAARLKEALEHNTTLRVLQIIEPELDEEGRPTARRPFRTRTVYESYTREAGRGDTSCGELTAALLEAALSSSSLQKVAIVPPRTALVDCLPGLLGAGGGSGGGREAPGDAGMGLPSAGSMGSVWGASGGPGSALQELVLSPVALSPRAVEQLAGALAALPMLGSGAVDGRKVAPRGWIGMTAPKDGDWWYVGDRLCYKYPDGWEPRPAQHGMAWVLGAADVKRRYAGLRRGEVVVARRHVDKERAGRCQYQPPASSDVLMPDLQTVVELLDKEVEGRNPTPRAAALRHWLVAACGPGSVPPPPRGVEYPMGGDDVELGVLEALEDSALEYRTLAEAALQEAPRRYWDRVNNGGMLPPARMAFKC